MYIHVHVHVVNASMLFQALGQLMFLACTCTCKWTHTCDATHSTKKATYTSLQNASNSLNTYSDTVSWERVKVRRKEIK